MLQIKKVGLLDGEEKRCDHGPTRFVDNPVKLTEVADFGTHSASSAGGRVLRR